MCLERKAPVRRTTLPPESVVGKLVRERQPIRGYSTDLSSSKQYSTRAMTRQSAHPPAWIMLVAVRDAMVMPFGVKPSGDPSVQADDERVDFFPGAMESNDEIVLGDDRHLTHRRCSVAKFSEPACSSSRQPSCTSSQCLRPHLPQRHQAPFHHLVVRTSLAHFARAQG